MRASGLVEARVQDRFYSLRHRTAMFQIMPYVITVLHVYACTAIMGEVPTLVVVIPRPLINPHLCQSN